MRTYTYIISRSFLTIAIMSWSLLAFSDGLLLPKDEGYPTDFLRNKITSVNVQINDLVATTTVYQEFLNEWDQTVDAVYNFPLPVDARSIELLYSYNDSLYKAVLRVEPENPNPGTGQGGIAALVNAYIGDNGLKLTLQDIAPGELKAIQLTYISMLDYHQGLSKYKYPLATGDFITYPIDHLEFNFEINTNRDIIAYDLPTHPDYQVLDDNPRALKLRMRKPMAYIASDLQFNFSVENTFLDVDFYSINSDTMDGHFAMFIRPEDFIDQSEVLDINVVFLLCNSSSMIGYKLEQSILAISNAIDLLAPDDNFNIILFNDDVEHWKSYYVPANETFIAEAKTFLQNVSGSGGNRMDLGLQAAIQQFQTTDFSNAIMAFTDGKSPIDPIELAQENTNDVGIFPVGIGEDVDRYRLDMTSALNYGFATYLSESDNLNAGILQVFQKISQPIIKNVSLDFNKPDVSLITPETYPSIFAGSYSVVTGRYEIPGSTTLNLSGQGTEGLQNHDFELEFSQSNEELNFPEKLWAKEKIDALEQYITIYGETDALKDSVIALSLSYEIRCMYTSYFADFDPNGGGGFVSNEEIMAPSGDYEVSFIASNYPNPFSQSTTIRIFLDENDEDKDIDLIIYDLFGRIAGIIHLENPISGWNEVILYAAKQNANFTEQGVYVVQMRIEGRTVSTRRIGVIQ